MAYRGTAIGLVQVSKEINASMRLAARAARATVETWLADYKGETWAGTSLAGLACSNKALSGQADGAMKEAALT